MTTASIDLVMSRVNTPKRTRREQAAATRERMIRAATEVFTEAGYVGARMNDIATRAGVAVQTVYFTFHTKGELLQACFDHAVLGPDRLPPEEQTFYAELLAARSGRAALKQFVAGNTAILARSAAIKEVAESAQHEPKRQRWWRTARACAARDWGASWPCWQKGSGYARGLMR